MEWKSYLKHGQQQVLLAALVLVSVDGEHDGLQQRVNLGHGDEPAEMRNVARLRLQQKQQIAVLLCLVVVGEETFLQFHALFEVARDFVLLRRSVAACVVRAGTHTSSSAMRFWISSAMRESR
jgi:hypothetical protein